MNKYDFIDFVVYDIHGIPRGREIARRRYADIMKKGIGLYSGICFFGIGHQACIYDYFGADRNFCNAYLVPVVDTLANAPSFGGSSDKKVGQVLCDVRLSDGTLEPTTPRYIAQRQIERLAKLGLTIKSSNEMEFSIVNKDGSVWGHRDHFCDMNIIDENREILMEYTDELAHTGVKADTLQTEAGPAQYELTLDVAKGIEGPDMTSRFKSVSRVFFRKRGLNATFMASVFYDGFGQGLHFNHSLWTADVENAFLDVEQPHKLSKFGRHWLAGLIIHSRALTAILCPTVNCYRRLHHLITPGKINWGPNNRLAAYRLVTEKDDNIYLECRIPSSAANPYLVMAGIIAAGLDGVNQEMSLDEVDQEAELPRTLEEALKLLGEDSVVVEALSPEFLKCYLYSKTSFEIDHFKNLDSSLSDEQVFEEEKKVYCQNI